MKIKTKKHHSVVDWDFTAGTFKVLSAATFVSAPTSLLVWNRNGDTIHPAILCRVAETLCIAQGEVRTWAITWDFSRDFRLTFRNQHTLGGASYSNCYNWRITGAWAHLFRTIADAEVLIGSIALDWPIWVWHHWRTRYWSGKTPGGADALCVELYWEVAGEWVQLGTTLYDTNDQWKDSEINRSGIGLWCDPGKGYYFDDTEIWGTV